MSKRQQLQNVNTAFEELTKLSPEEVRALAKEIDEAGGNDAWLVKKRAVYFRQSGPYRGSMVIVREENGSIPYQDLIKKIEQVEDYKRRKQYAEDLEVERLTGVNPGIERSKKLFSEMRSLFGQQFKA